MNYLALRLIKNISNTSQTNFKAAYKIASNKRIYIQNSKQPAQINIPYLTFHNIRTEKQLYFHFSFNVTCIIQ